METQDFIINRRCFLKVLQYCFFIVPVTENEGKERPLSRQKCLHSTSGARVLLRCSCFDASLLFWGKNMMQLFKQLLQLEEHITQFVRKACLRNCGNDLLIYFCRSGNMLMSTVSTTCHWLCPSFCCCPKRTATQGRDAMQPNLTATPSAAVYDASFYQSEAVEVLSLYWKPL